MWEQRLMQRLMQRWERWEWRHHAAPSPPQAGGQLGSHVPVAQDSKVKNLYVMDRVQYVQKKQLPHSLD